MVFTTDFANPKQWTKPRSSNPDQTTKNTKLSMKVQQYLVPTNKVLVTFYKTLRQLIVFSGVATVDGLLGHSRAVGSIPSPKNDQPSDILHPQICLTPSTFK
jgi:hypothetical protein